VSQNTSTSRTSQSQPVGETTHQFIHERLVEWLNREAAVDVEKIEYDASLFELGIDSMGAASLAGELEQHTGKTLNPEVMYELETINDLAEYVDGLPVARHKPLLGTPSAAQTAAAPASTPPLEGSQVGATDAAEATNEGQAIFSGDLIHHYERMNRRIHSLKEHGLYFFEPVISEHDGAWVVANGKRMLMLGSYEYLGLLGHPHLKQTAIAAIEKFGTGHHGVRLLAGTTTIHKTLEQRLAKFVHAEDAMVYSSGYVANLSTISALVGRGECVIGDQWNHASIADGCRASGAEFLEFRHNDMDSLVEKLREADGRRTLVVVDAVFSMDGDIIDLPAVVDICKQYNALLMVDEAHSLGVLGKTGHGVQEHFNLPPDAVVIKMGTLSKTLAGCGGYVAAKSEVITFLRHHARGYIFSGALPAGQTSVAIAALDVIEQEPELVERLWRNVWHFINGLKKLGFDTAKSVTPIVPLMTRNDELTLEMTRLCRNDGLLVIPVAFPAVPLDAPRLRNCVSAIHTPEDIDFALETLARAGRQTGLIS
jgi:8-amino-7-oxononanoate synthase